MDQIAKILSDWEQKSEWLLHDSSGNRTSKKKNLDRWNGLRSSIRKASKKGSPVIICLPHGETFLLSLLACLKENVPFVPCLPSWPVSRFEQLKEFVEPSLVIEAHNFDSLCSATATDLASSESNQTAYIMFTSGTTGKPKGVCISRNALGNFWTWLDKYFCDLKLNSNQLLVTQFTFDISLLDVGIFLLKDTALYFSQFGGNAFLLGAELEQWNIEFLNTVPNNINSFVQAGMHSRCDLSHLNYILIGGAKFSTSTYQGVCESWSKGARIFNFYGPTETTIYTHVHEITKDTLLDCRDKNVTVGKPVQGVSHAIKNATDNALLPTEQIGEILLGGKQLMEGYFKDPATTEKVIFHHNSEKYYRTGDLGLEDKSGRLFVVGRLDETIKRRGFRVNLLDIDAYVQKISGVMDCMTLAYPDEGLENWLLLVAICKDDVTKEGLLLNMKTLLLEHQVPDEIVFTKKFPVNSSGKVDRKALMTEFAHLKADV